MRVPVSIFCLFVFSMTAAVVAGEPILLKYKLEPGEVQSYQVSMDLRVDAAVKQGGKTESTKIDMHVGMGVALKCISSDENEFICEACFYSPQAELNMEAMGTRVRAVMDYSGVKMYKGGKLVKSVQWSDFNDPSMPNIGDLSKVRIRCRIGRNGELLEIYDGEELAKKFPGFDFDQMMGQQIVFPTHPIDIGESWEATIDTDFDNGIGCGISVGKIENKFKYTLSKIGKYNGVRCAVIDVKGTTTTKEKDSDIKLNQTVNGTTIVELETGKVMFAKADVAQSIDGEISGADVNVSTTGSMTIRYNGNRIPSEAIEEEMLARIDPDLLKALNEIRVPIVLVDRIKIGDKFYKVRDIVVVNNTKMRLLKFSEDRIYLKDDKSGIIYKILMNFRGEVTSIKPLMGKQG